ncbi:antirestriction protein ArdA [Tsukamurella spumae]|uniref:Antirestriction protein ArdA n=2 Tax=Tsukamurella spumae TaxID=44753 RepID=A0A846X3Z6_9ACTN|nr:antirestriction protein ArdA [Tsukamurella spumae]
MSAAEAARQHNEANALSSTDPAYLVPPIVVVDRRIDDRPQVWIGCLECYNAGDLVGHWYPAADAAGVTTDALHGRPVAPETHEELWVMDSERIPVRYEMSPATATAWAEVLDGVPEHQRPAFDAWILDRDWHTDPDPELVTEFDEKYAGEWDSFEDFAREWIASTGLLDGVPEELSRYFDHRAYARDLEHNYDVIRCPGGVYVFHQ